MDKAVNSSDRLNAIKDLKDTKDTRKAAPVKKRAPGPVRWFRRMLKRVLSVVIAALFILNLVVPDREFSPRENRNLATLPRLSGQSLADGSFFTGLSDYWSDQFFLRDTCIEVRTSALKLIGRREINDIYLGKDGYLIQEPVVPDSDALEKTTKAVNAFTAAHTDIKSYMLMVPGAAAILTDKLPADAPVRDQLSDIQDVTSDLTGVTILDAASPLQEGKDEDIYYRTDHHWTLLGAQKVYESVAESMGITPELTGTNHVVSKNFRGTQASGSGSMSSEDTISVYVPDETDVKWLVSYPDSGEKSASFFDADKLDTADQYAVFFGGNHPRVEIETTNRNGKVLLVFKDSYANCFIPFMVPQYEKIIMIDPRYYYDSLQSLMSSEGITDVLYLYSANTLLQDKSLADVLGS